MPFIDDLGEKISIGSQVTTERSVIIGTDQDTSDGSSSVDIDIQGLATVEEAVAAYIDVGGDSDPDIVGSAVEEDDNIAVDATAADGNTVTVTAYGAADADAIDSASGSFSSGDQVTVVAKGY